MIQIEENKLCSNQKNMEKGAEIQGESTRPSVPDLPRGNVGNEQQI